MKRVATALAMAMACALFLATPSARANDTVAIASRAAVHDARISGDSITWRSQYVGNSADFRAGQALRLDLARPIEATVDAARSPGVTPIVNGEAKNAIVAFVIDVDHLPAWSDAITITLLAKRWSDSLEPPLARGDVEQRIVVSGDDDLRFEPTEPALERHVGYWAAPSSRESDRRACDETIGARASLPLDEIPIYVTGTDNARPIAGHFSTGPERARAGVLVSTILFVFVASLLGLAHRLLSGRARIEQADAFLREEFGDAWKK